MDNALERILRSELQPDTSGTFMGGPYARWFFPNGYGASVVNHYGSYGVELAVLAGDEDNWTLTYQTPVTNDVIGHIETAEELSEILWRIKSLPPRSDG